MSTQGKHREPDFSMADWFCRSGTMYAVPGYMQASWFDLFQIFGTGVIPVPVLPDYGTCASGVRHDVIFANIRYRNYPGTGTTGLR